MVVMDIDSILHPKSDSGDPLLELELDANWLLHHNGTMELIKLLYNGHSHKEGLGYEDLKKCNWDVSLISEQVEYI